MKVLIVVPVYNEEAILEKNILELFEFCLQNLPKDNWQIIIADNKSSDQSSEIAEKLAKKDRIEYLFIPQKGKGGAIRLAWQKFRADIYFFMDADLSVDLEALLRFLSFIKEGTCDLAIGSRSVKEARLKRTFVRKTLSYFLNLFLKIIFGSSVKDHPCGFKAVNKKVVNELLPLIKNNDWFFDTELLLWAQKRGFKIKELPVKESGRPCRKSKIGILGVTVSYLKEIARLKREMNRS